MNIQEIKDIRGFRIPLQYDDNQYVDIYVTPTDEEERGINGYLMDHMVMASGYGIDFDEDGEIVMHIAREMDPSYDPFESEDENLDIIAVILKSLPL